MEKNLRGNTAGRIKADDLFTQNRNETSKFGKNVCREVKGVAPFRKGGGGKKKGCEKNRGFSEGGRRKRGERSPLKIGGRCGHLRRERAG